MVVGLEAEVDGYPARTHKLNTRTGGEPLEDGREVTDHAVAAPQVVVLSGSVSDFKGDHRPAEAFAAIEALQQSVEPVRLITEWKLYDEMLITRCEPITSGRGMDFEMELKQVLRVSAASAPDVPRHSLQGVAQERPGSTNRGRVPISTVSGSRLPFHVAQVFGLTPPGPIRPPLGGN